MQATAKKVANGSRRFMKIDNCIIMEIMLNRRAGRRVGKYKRVMTKRKLINIVQKAKTRKQELIL